MVPVPAGNLAQGAAAYATASSVENAGLPASYAVDGNASTRWSSAWSDPQWIKVDLGAVYLVNHVVLNWEAAYGKAYRIEVSTDGTAWTEKSSVTNGKGGIDDIVFGTTNARYVRLWGTKRGTSYGYSLYEFEVYGPTDPSVLDSVSVSPATVAVVNGGTQTFTATGLDQYGAAYPTTVDWTVSGGGTIDPVSGLFTATTVGGPFTVTATSTAPGSISGTAEVTVVPVPAGNLAQGAAAYATASSVENAGLPASYAIDGNASTRWSSAWSDPQWITVDLGAVYLVNHVVLNWEAAYGKAYRIEVSTDGVTWNQKFSETNGNGGIDDIVFATTDARYVRMSGTARGTSYGYSLYEFEVYGPTDPSVLDSVSVSPATAAVVNGGTQTFTATGLDQYGAAYPTTVDWTVSGGGTIDPVSGLFTATTVGGPFTVTATSTAPGSISGLAEVTVVPVPAGNLAQGVAASSVENAGLPASYAVDGNASTRWSSAWSDPQWITVDLGAVYLVNHVILNWEAAYGKAYRIEVSTDGVTWNQKFSETNGNGGIDDIVFAATNARYVRLWGTERGTPYGYSLYEFEVYAATDNISPVATGTCDMTPQSQGLTGTLTATDQETPALLMYSLADGTTGPYITAKGGEVTITDPTTGAFTYQPRSLAEHGKRGRDTFAFRVTDPDGGIGSATQTVIVDQTIMPLGDSITEGEPWPYAETRVAYRLALHDLLVNNGFNFDFVGTLSNGYAVANFDPDHEGHPGWTASEIAWGRTGYPTDGVRAWLDQNPADFILLHAGTNAFDVNNDIDVEVILDEIDAWEASANGNHVTVVLALIIDWNPLNPDVPVFNSNLLAMANNRIANGDDIIVVNEHDALTYPDDLADKLHPTPAGYDKMANPWFDALANVVDKCP